MEFSIWGLFWAGIGFLILKYRMKVREATGVIGFAEQYLGAGGTNTFIVIVGICLLVFGGMATLGVLDDFMIHTFGWLKPGF